MTLLVLTIVFGLRIGRYNEDYYQLMQLQGRLRDAQASRIESEVVELQAEADALYGSLAVPRQRARWHILIGIVASLVAVLVNSLSVTYFIGTSRWCKEVVETYQLDAQLTQRSVQLKRRSFPWALMGILMILTIVALGAASDPGTLRETTIRWVLPHYTAALGGAALLSISFFMQASYIRQNSDLVESILQRVREIRLARGLEIEA